MLNYNPIVQVLLGDHDITTDNETQSLRVGVSSLELHPQYDRWDGVYQTSILTYLHTCFSLTSDYDVALIRLSSPVNFTSQPHVRPICLPQMSDSPSSYAGALATVTGWGTIYSSGPTSDVLQVRNTPLLSCSEPFIVLFLGCERECAEQLRVCQLLSVHRGHDHWRHAVCRAPPGGQRLLSGGLRSAPVATSS